MSSQLPIIGLSTDTEKINQPENTYSFALNMVHDSAEGSQGALVNENANRLCVELDGDLVGVISINGQTLVAFTEPGRIYKVDTASCTAQLLVYLPCLNFSAAYPITGEHRVVRGCEDVIYWRDSLNQDRTLNLDSVVKWPERYEDCTAFSLNPDVQHPETLATILSAGGKLAYGAYSFVIELLDSGQNVVLRSMPTNPVYIGPGVNIASNSAEAGGLPESPNAIQLSISKLDTRFSYYRIAVLRTISSDGIATDAHYVGEPVPYSSSASTFVYRGFNAAEGDFLIDKNSILTTFMLIYHLFLTKRFTHHILTVIYSTLPF